MDRNVNLFIGPGASTGLQFLHVHLARLLNMEAVYEPIAYKLGTLPNLKNHHPFEPDEDLRLRVKCFRGAPDIDQLESYLIAKDQYLFNVQEHNFELPKVKEYEALLVEYIREICRYYDGGDILIGECRLQHNIAWVNHVLKKHGFNPQFLLLTRDVVQILYLEYRHLGLTVNSKRRFLERYELCKRIYKKDEEFGCLFERAQNFWDFAFVVVWIELRIFERSAQQFSNVHLISYESLVLDDGVYETVCQLAELFGCELDLSATQKYVQENLVGTGKIETYKGDVIFQHKLKKTLSRLFVDQKDHFLFSQPSLSQGRWSLQSVLYFLSSIDTTGFWFKFVRIWENDAKLASLWPQRFRLKS